MRVYCSKACQEYCPELNKLKECYDIVRNDLSRMTEERDWLKAENESNVRLARHRLMQIDFWKFRAKKLADLTMKKIAFKFTDPQGNMAELITVAQETVADFGREKME